MRRKINPEKAIFDEIYNVYKNVKPKCKPPKKKRKVNHTTKERREKIRKLETYADKLFQMACKIKFPISVTGDPTEVTHHFVPKSQSNNLRYDFLNACPATEKWHYRHHTFGDPTLVNAFYKKFGQERIDYLTEQRQVYVKETEERLRQVIDELEVIIYGKKKRLPWE